MKIIAQNRWQAFGFHTLISLLVFLVLAGIIFFYWYPGFLFLYDGGLEGMKFVAGVDFFIGPFLTLLVYKLGKKSLRFDLTCIVLLQIACLMGGMWTIWQTRPVAVVYAAGRFTVINQLGFQNEKINLNNVPLVSEASWPVWLAVNVSDADAATASAIWSIMGSSFAYNTENYVSYIEYITHIKNAGLTREQVAREIEMGKNNIFSEVVRFYPVTTSMHEGYLAVNTNTGKVEDAFFKDGFL